MTPFLDEVVKKHTGSANACRVPLGEHLGELTVPIPLPQSGGEWGL